MGYATGAPRQSSTQTGGTSGTRRERARTGKECAESPVGRHDDVSADSYSEDEHSRTSRAPGRGGGRAGGRGASSSGNGREKVAAGSGRDGVDRADRHDRRPSEKCLDDDSTEYESKDEPTDSCTDDDFSENEEASDASDNDGSDVDGSDNDGSSNRSSPRSSDRSHTSLSAASLDHAAASIAGASVGDEPAELMHGSNASYAGTGGGNCGARLPAGNAAGGRLASNQARSMRKCISGDRATMGSGSMDLDRCKQGGPGIAPRGAAGAAGGCNAPRPSGNQSCNQPGNQQCAQPVRQNVRPSVIARSMSVPDEELERIPQGGYQQQHGPSHGQGYIHGQMNGQPEYAYRQPGPGKLQMKALRRAQSGRLNPSNGSANNGSPSTSSSSRTAMPRSMSAKAPSPTPPYLPNGIIDLYPVEPLSPTEIQTPVGAPPARRDFPSLPMLDIPWCSADSPRSPPKPINVGPPLRSCSLGPASGAAQQVRAGGRIGMKAGQGMGAGGGDGGGGRGGGVPERSMSVERRVKAQAARNAVRVVELGGPTEGLPAPHAVAVTAAGALAGTGGAAGEMGAVAVAGAGAGAGAGHGKKGHLRGFFASWGGH
ncbi:unnamed protein product [Closterium sp. NIES-64]|nr:unnamed protein product [Closterium sp. NIES-64]